jgi:hypothetical protein
MNPYNQCIEPATTSAALNNGTRGNNLNNDLKWPAGRGFTVNFATSLPYGCPYTYPWFDSAFPNWRSSYWAKHSSTSTSSSSSDRWDKRQEEQPAPNVVIEEVTVTAGTTTTTQDNQETTTVREPSTSTQTSIDATVPAETATAVVNGTATVSVGQPDVQAGGHSVRASAFLVGALAALAVAF